MNEIQFLIYDEGGQTEVLVQDETLWATQKSIAELFSVSVPTINEHLKNIFESGELEQNPTIRKFRIVRQEGSRQVTREIEHYNLDAIISVGYRVNSQKATKFRIWATSILKDYIQKGFVIDAERMKRGENAFGKDYFRDLLETVRSIRASERRIWQQITDVFAEISYDYDKNASITQEFYATVQNKFHYAITGQTAAEIVYTHADQSKNHMGLTTWKNAPDGRILQTDVSVAKKYLDAKQIRQLERAVSGYFDYIEDLIERENAFTMEQFASSVNEFLAFRRYDILPDKGRISAAAAKKKAEAEYDAFNKTQRIVSDFDREVQRLIESEKRP